MELVLLLVLSRRTRRSGVGHRPRPRRSGQLAKAEAELEPVKRLADEDITGFGEELQDLDLDMVGKDLGDGARRTTSARWTPTSRPRKAVGKVTQAEEIKHVIEILEDGRYAAACVRARVNGEPLPQRRPSCFFNPQHGPSVEDVSWAPPGGAPREVPACAADAERVRAGAEPDVRKVMVGPQRVPYWEGGPAYSPYAQGMFGALGPMDWMFMGMLFSGGFDGLGEGIGALGEGLGDMFGSIGDGIGGMFDGFDF